MSDDRPPPQDMRELLHDLEFVVRQHALDMPPRVIDCLNRLDAKRNYRAKHGNSRFADVAPKKSTPEPEPITMYPQPPPGLFDETESEIKW